MDDFLLIAFISLLYAVGLITGFLSARAIYKRKIKHFYADLAADKFYVRANNHSLLNNPSPLNDHSQSNPDIAQ